MIGATSHELEVLVRLGCFHYLSSAHVEAFLFDGSPVSPRSRTVLTQRILARLLERGLIGATERVIGRPGGGSTRRAVYLRPPGAALLAGLAPRAGRAPTRRGLLFVEHALTTAEVAVIFTRSAQAHLGHELLSWQSDWDLESALRPSPVRPDGQLVYATRTQELDAFLEVDLGTESPATFGQKIVRYLDLYRSGAWTGVAPTWPLVLTVTPGSARTESLRRTTETVLLTQPDHAALAVATEFRFAALSELRGSNGPLGEIWQIAGRRGRHPLEAAAAFAPGREVPV